MIDWIIEFALRQRIMVLVMAVMLSMAGYLAYQQLPIDAFPDVSSTQVKVIVKSAGMTPEEVEMRITAPIEVEMLGIPQQSGLRSVAKYALTDITVDFEDGTDIYWARQQVSERLSNVWGNLPSNVTGGIAPMTTPLGEMFMFTVESETLSLEEKRNLLDWVIRPQLRTVPGVADVNALGGMVRTFEIVPNNAKMYARGVSINLLRDAIVDNNHNDGAGRLSDNEDALLVRSEGAIKTLDDVRDIVVKSIDGNPVFVADVAEVRIGALTRYGAVTANGKGEAVEGLVLGLRGANARAVVEGVRAKLAEIAPTLPKGVTTNVFYDRGNLVERAVHTVNKALTEAVVLVIILLILFLGNWRAALTIAFSLPLSVLTTFLLMKQFGMSANLMSLGGLAIAIGMLVDSSVVVVENIMSHLAHTADKHVQSKMSIIMHAMREVSLPVASGVVIIITVFVPLLTLQGLEGKLFSPVAMTIIFALAGSLVLSLTVIPVIASFLIKDQHEEEPWLVKKLSGIYAPALQKAMRYPNQLLMAAGVLLALTVVVYFSLVKPLCQSWMKATSLLGLKSCHLLRCNKVWQRICKCKKTS